MILGALEIFVVEPISSDLFHRGFREASTTADLLCFILVSLVAYACLLAAWTSMLAKIGKGMSGLLVFGAKSVNPCTLVIGWLLTGGTIWLIVLGQRGGVLSVVLPQSAS